MKQNKTIALLALVALTAVFCRCSSDPLANVDKQLLSNAEGYIQAMADYDIAAARPFATEETNNITLNYFQEMMDYAADSAADFIAQNTPAEIHIDSVLFASDTSATVYFNKKTPIQHLNATLTMRQRNGKWLAHQVIDTKIQIGQ